MITWNWSDTDCKNEWAISTHLISLTGPLSQWLNTLLLVSAGGFGSAVGGCWVWGGCFGPGGMVCCEGLWGSGGGQCGFCFCCPESYGFDQAWLSCSCWCGASFLRCWLRHDFQYQFFFWLLALRGLGGSFWPPSSFFLDNSKMSDFLARFWLFPVYNQRRLAI